MRAKNLEAPPTSNQLNFQWQNLTNKEKEGFVFQAKACQLRAPHQVNAILLRHFRGRVVAFRGGVNWQQKLGLGLMWIGLTGHFGFTALKGIRL